MLYVALSQVKYLIDLQVLEPLPTIFQNISNQELFALQKTHIYKL